MIHMRAFGTANPRAVIHLFALSDETVVLRIQLLHQNPLKAIDHINQVFPVIRVMEQGGIEADAVEIDRF